MHVFVAGQLLALVIKLLFKNLGFNLCGLVSILSAIVFIFSGTFILLIMKLTEQPSIQCYHSGLLIPQDVLTNRCIQDSLYSVVENFNYEKIASLTGHSILFPGSGDPRNKQLRYYPQYHTRYWL